MRYLIICILSLTLLVGCGEQSVRDSDQNIDTKRENDLKISELSTRTSLEYLNDYRILAGLSMLRENENLKVSASSHSYYLVQNGLYTHYQQIDLKYYTGYTPVKRALYAGYDGVRVYENIYAGDTTVKEAIDILFSNIYHRLSFLAFDIDESGAAESESVLYPFKKVFVYEMGSSKEFFLYQNEKPEVVVWPYKDQKDVLPFFYEEDPDPLPECSVSGYPVSIQFNPDNNANIELLSFELYESDGEKIVNADMLDAANDPNTKFTKEHFALMPQDRLKWGSKYTAIVVYMKNNEEKITKKWSFKTKSLPKPNFTVMKKQNIFNVKSGVEYHFYLPPLHCNDMFTKFKYSITSGLIVEQKMIDNNTIKIRVTGKGTVKVYTENLKEFTLIVR